MQFFCYRSHFGRNYHAMSDQATGATVSDYDAIGGGPAVSAVVNDFYVRVLADPQLAPYFEGVDIVRLKRHQVLLVSQVLGGPDKYDGRPLGEAHAGLGIDHDDFTAVAGHLTASMKDAGVPEDVVMRAMATVAATEPDIVESGSP
jgi:hemoglobin